MVKVAENALANHPNIKKVIIINHPPRFDTPNMDPMSLKSKLANYANSFSFC